MGIIVRYLPEIPKEYIIYTIYIPDRYGSIAERVFI